MPFSGQYDPAMFQPGSGLGLYSMLSGLGQGVPPLSGLTMGALGFSPFAGEGNILGGGGGFGQTGGGMLPGQTPQPGLSDEALGLSGGMIGGGALGFGGGALGQMGGAGTAMTNQPSPVAGAGAQTSGDIMGLIKTAAGVGKVAQDAQALLQRLFGQQPQQPGLESYDQWLAGTPTDVSGLSFESVPSQTPSPLAGTSAGTGYAPFTPEFASQQLGSQGFGNMSPDAWQAMQGGGGFGGAIPTESLYGIEAGLGGTAGQTAGDLTGAAMGNVLGGSNLLSGATALYGLGTGIANENPMQATMSGQALALALMGYGPLGAVLGVPVMLQSLFGGSESSSIGRERGKDVSSAQQAHEAVAASLLQRLQETIPQLQSQGDIDFLGGQFARTVGERIHDQPAYLAAQMEGGQGSYPVPESYGITQALAQLRSQLQPGGVMGLLPQQAQEQQAFAQLMAQREATMQAGTGLVPGVGQLLGYGETGPIFSPWVRDESQMTPYFGG